MAAAYMDVNGRDPSGLWTYESMYEAYLKEYGEDGFKLLQMVVNAAWQIQKHDYFHYDWDIYKTEKVIGIASSWAFTDSNEEAAEQLYDALSDEFDTYSARFMRKAYSCIGGKGIAKAQDELFGGNLCDELLADISLTSSTIQNNLEYEALFSFAGAKTVDLAIDGIRA